MTDLYAVIGNPVAHSKSPLIHAAFAQQTGQDLRYERVPARPDGFAVEVKRFRAAGGRGLNVTIPFKEEAFALANEVSDRAKAAGAANTLSFEDGGIIADNTDGVGLVRDIAVNCGYGLKGRRILVMGAGGAARGILGPLKQQEPAYLAIVNRNLPKARVVGQGFSISDVFSYTQLRDKRFDVIINATASGLGDGLPPLPPGLFSGTFVYDLMYGAAALPFLRYARDDGAAGVMDGLGMLVEQAAESFYVWRGIRPQTAEVLKNLRGGLNGAAG